MKRLIAIAVLTVAASSLAFGQVEDKKMSSKNKVSKGGSTEEMLMQMERDFADALVRRDTSANERFEADDIISIGPDGSVTNKSQDIAALKSGDLKLESIAIDDMKVKVFGDTAVVTYRTTDKGTYKGQDISGQHRWTDVWVKRNGKWQIVATQGTTVAQPQTAPQTTRQQPTQSPAANTNTMSYDAYVGQYDGGTRLGVITIMQEGDKLFGQPEGRRKVELTPQSGDKFMASTEGIEITFARDDKGQVMQIVLRRGEEELQAKKIK